MCLSRAAHHKLSLRHGYCFGKQLRSITTIPVCINFRLYYVSKNAESQFSIMQLLNIFFQSFRNVNLCTYNNIFLIFCGIFFSCTKLPALFSASQRLAFCCLPVMVDVLEVSIFACVNLFRCAVEACSIVLLSVF